MSSAILAELEYAVSGLTNPPLWALPVTALALIAFSYLYAHFVTHSALRGIPGPLAAKLSNVWLFSTARRGVRSRTIHDLHQRLGPLVRIQPNHVSIVDEDAVKVIYGHGSGLPKADYYDAFLTVNSRPGIFSTRSRKDHTRKRKMVSHVFSAASVRNFEPFMKGNLENFVRQWDRLCAEAGGTARFDALDWFNYLAFDMISDLAFGRAFGMLLTGKDMAELRETPTSPPTYTSAIEVLHHRGQVNSTVGCIPSPYKPWARYIPDPFFRKGIAVARNAAKIAIAAVRDRLENPPTHDREDLLARLAEARDEKGSPISRDELTAEAMTQLIAGSDTTANSSCAMLYYAAGTPGVLEKLQAELDDVIDEDSLPTYDAVKGLPYLDAVYKESMRIHSTVAIGLPRIVPDDSPGVTVAGHYFPPGTVLSVPIYSLHHSKDIWGDDADTFRPERWEHATPRQNNAFMPFSTGPRGCIGRNVAEMELKLMLAAWARRYTPVIEERMDIEEAFLNKPVSVKISLTRR
ncbi:hypothetical protein Q8F55_002254 [Vanrija albida]|uniref:Benzoate 4-monooxygenase n=1 Tax=Vanrija albida TaxID=181172 RepID=A0ABR3QAA1_9TREE